MKKRALPLLLALILLLALAVPVHAADTPEIHWFEGEYPDEVAYLYTRKGYPWQSNRNDPGEFSTMSLGDQYIFNAANNTVRRRSEEVENAEYDVVWYYSERPNIVIKEISGGLLYGYADDTGKVVIPLQYSSAYEFHNGIALVEDADQNYLLIDTTGKVVKALPYDEVNYDDGYYIVTNYGDSWTYGVINSKGEPVIGMTDKHIYDICGNLVLFWENNTYAGAMNMKGEVVIPAKYIYIYHRHGVVICEDYREDPENHYYVYPHAVYDTKGNLITPLCDKGFYLIHDGYDYNYNRENNHYVITDSADKTVLDTECYVHDSGWGLIAGYMVNDEDQEAMALPTGHDYHVWNSKGELIIDGLDNVLLSGKYVFVLKDGKVGYFLNPCYKDHTSKSMTDITAVNSWAAPGVDWALSNGYALPTTSTFFGVNLGCPRWEVVYVIWQAAGCKEPTITQCPFNDVSESDEYYKAVLWAYENKVTSGKSAAAFGPDDTVTRAQAVTMIYKAANAPAVTGSNPFTDVPAGQYFADPVIWASANGVCGGKTDTTFVPHSPVTRGEMMAFLYKWNSMK